MTTLGQAPISGFRLRRMPLGWYAVAESRELRPGGHLTREYFGQKLRFYRDKAGVVKATSPASLHRWPLREHNGLIFAWYHPERKEPSFEVPVLPTNGWTDFRIRELTVRSHPQETSENSVDIGHFVQLHGFRDAWYEGDLEVKDHLLLGAYGITYPLPGGKGFLAKFGVEVHGLGYSLVKIHVPFVNNRFHTLILSTPIDEERVHVRMGMSMKNWGPPGVSHLVREIASARLSYEVAQDGPIWEAKRYLDKPQLADGDGPIGAYRRYCTQFYPEQRVETQAPARRQQTAA